MDKSFYFENEKLVSEADNKLVTLTTHRVRMNTGNRIVSIMLPQVSSVEIHYLTNVWYLILAGIGALGGVLYTVSENDAAGLVIGGAIVALFYFLFLKTKKHTLSIASSSNKIDLMLKGMKHNNILTFVNDLEQAIANYS